MEASKQRLTDNAKGQKETLDEWIRLEEALIEDIKEKMLQKYRTRRDSVLSKDETGEEKELGETISLSGYCDCIIDLLKVLTEM